MPKIVDHEARRRELSAVAASLIAAGGLEAATIREVAQGSGFSKGVVEHYFDNKEALISGALAWANGQYQSRVDKATAGLTGLRALRGRIEAMLPMSTSVRDEWKVRLVFWSMAAIDKNLGRQQGARFRRAVALYEQDIVAAIAANEMPPAEDTRALARRVVNMSTGIATAAMHNTSLYSRAFLQGELDYLIGRLATRK